MNEVMSIQIIGHVQASLVPMFTKTYRERLSIAPKYLA